MAGGQNIRGGIGCGKMPGFLLLLLILGQVLTPAARAFSFTARVSGIPLARQPSTAHTHTHRQMYNTAEGRCKAVAAQGVRSMVARGDGSDSGAASTDDDWRQFRAKLVAQEKGNGTVNLVQDQWAYNAGNLVEQGSLLLGGSELQFGFGLRQQYFHKCVLLILSHTKDFTRGVIVNRPTNRRTADGWRIWYGGDVQGMSAEEYMQEAVCLHRSSSQAVIAKSEEVFKGVYTCSFLSAQECVKQGKASSEEFWLILGYAGWAPGQLQMEIDARASWHVAAASSALLNELITEARGCQTAEAGIGVWEKLMSRIGLKDKADRISGSFDDRMLREYAREHWTKQPLVLQSEALDKLMRAAARRARRADSGTPAGTILRTSSSSPYILEQQFLHKALLLVLQDTPEMTIAVVLNRQTRTAINTITKQAAFQGSTAVKKRFLFFGGEYDAGSNRVMWLTASEVLRAQGIGQEVGGELASAPRAREGVVISRCSGAAAVEAINANKAKAEDFLLIRGFCLWPKGQVAVEAAKQQAWKGGKTGEGGLQSEIDLGRFEEVRGLPLALWHQLLQLAEPTDTEHVDVGTAVWEATAGVTVESTAQPSETKDEGVEPDLAARAALGDEALEQFASYFFTAPDN